jgi:hypothetical protein
MQSNQHYSLLRTKTKALACAFSLLTAASIGSAGRAATGVETADAPVTDKDPVKSDIVLQCMSDEIARSMKDLQLSGKPKPYYLRYELYDTHNKSINYELGARTYLTDKYLRGANADLRVGSYEYDNTVHPDGSRPRSVSRTLPIDNRYGPLRKQLWLLTDEAYKYATEQFDQGRAFMQGHDVRHTCEAFSKETPKKTVLPLVPDVDLSPVWFDRVKELSKIFAQYPLVRSSCVSLDTNNGTRRVVTSEGTVSRYSRGAIEIGIVAYARTPDGVDTWDSAYVSADAESDLPAFEELQAKVHHLADSLSKEASAERLDYYYGPVLFESTAATEVIQHGIAPLLCAIPGDNFKPSRTLLRSMNMRILPDFLNIRDDPSIKTWAGRPLAAHGIIDSDGIPTEKVNLVEHGFLRNLLSGRTPVFPGQHSNGHNLSDEVTPTTLIVSTDRSLEKEALRKKLLDLAKARGLSYAIVIRRIVPSNALVINGTSEEARSDSLNNRLVEVFAVDVNSGKERRVRGLQISDFGRAHMDSIVAAGSDPEAHTTANWRGYIRSVVSPSLLVENMELEEDAGDSLSPYPVDIPKLAGEKNTR